MLLGPGESFDYDGRRLRYPDIRLVYWCGGNPFHHHQDLNRLVDDSPVARSLLKGILDADSQLEVVGEAKDGVEAVELVACLKPNIVTMDVQMPRMDGFRAIEEIMISNPTPIVVVSSTITAICRRA